MKLSFLLILVVMGHGWEMAYSRESSQEGSSEDLNAKRSHPKKNKLSAPVIAPLLDSGDLEELEELEIEEDDIELDDEAIRAGHMGS